MSKCQKNVGRKTCPCQNVGVPVSKCRPQNVPMSKCRGARVEMSPRQGAKRKMYKGHFDMGTGAVKMSKKRLQLLRRSSSSTVTNKV